MNEARQLAAHLPPIQPEITETSSKKLLIVASSEISVSALRALPDRLDDQQLAVVRSIAAAAPAPLPACEERAFNKCMRMMSILPRKADDEVKAELRIALYHKKIGSYPDEAINFLASQALERCTFFPSIRECLAILNGWKRDDEPARVHYLAGLICRREHQARFDEAMGRLARRDMSQDEIDALPASWKEVGEARALLWRCDCGSYVARPLPF